MLLRFELTMPNVGSWNGVDTGIKENFYIFRNVNKKQAEKIVDKNFYYNFGDGWGANVKVTKNRKSKTSGFRGYDWMVDEIIEYGVIYSLKIQDQKNLFEYDFGGFISRFAKKHKINKDNIDFITSEMKPLFKKAISELEYLEIKK